MQPLNIIFPLASNPQPLKSYFVEIKTKKSTHLKIVNPKVARSLLLLMNQGAVNGGAACHWGGPSAMVEAWSACFALMFEKSPWYESYNFINDLGHAENALYALRAVYQHAGVNFETLKTFRAFNSKLTGHGESHLFPEGVLLSNGPLGSSLPQAQGLSLADKLAQKKRITICSLSDGAFMEGEAKEAISAISGLRNKDKLNPFILLLSDNNTKLGGRIDQDSFSLDKSFFSLENQGWKVLKVENGNHLEDVTNNLQLAMDLSTQTLQPVCVWLKTVKGYGLKSTEDSSSGGHGYPLKAFDKKLLECLAEIWKEESVPEVFIKWAHEVTQPSEKSSAVKSTEKSEKIQAGIARALIKCKKEGFPLFSVSSDLSGSTGTKDFQKAYPDSFLDIGVAEANMISTAVGMSKLGYIPVVDTFAAFGVTKGNLPLIMGSLSQAPVICIFSHTGFQDAADGASHQSLTYLSALSSIPNLRVVNLSSSDEAEFYLELAIRETARQRQNNKKCSSYVFFLGRENFPVSFMDKKQLNFGSSEEIIPGDQVTVVATGSTLVNAHQAVKELKDEGISACLIHHPCVNWGKIEKIKENLAKTKRLVTVEDHQLIGGMGAMLTHQLVLGGSEFKLVSLGVKGEFGQSAYSAQELYQKHEIDANAIKKAVMSFL